MPHVVTIKGLPQAFDVIKEMDDRGYDWGEDYRRAGRDAVVDFLEGRMHEAVDRHLETLTEGDEADRRNGYYRRWLLTELGRIELCVPRTRRFSPSGVIQAYARRARHIDRMILACFVLGLSTRKVASLRADLDELLACFRYTDAKLRKTVRTTNAIERRFREVRRRTRPMGVFADQTSMERILFAVFTHENQSQGVSTPFLLTQNS